MTLSPAPSWPQVHVELHESPGWLDDCFRSSLWAKILSAASESFANGNTIAGDYATMAVMEGTPPTGCGWERDISSLSLLTHNYPQIRIRLRGRGTAPQYKVDVLFTDASSVDTGFLDAPTSFTTVTLQLMAGKTVHKVRLYAKSSTGGASAQIDYDYAVIQSQFPIIPYEVYEADVDLQHTIATGAYRIRAHHDVLQGVTGFRYRFDEDVGSLATDLGLNRLNGTLINGPTWQAGKYNSCLRFDAASSQRVDTGYLPTIPATGGATIAFWMKASSGATGVIVGAGKAPGGVFNRCQVDLQAGDHVRIYAKDDDANVRQYTSIAVVSDDTWHHVAAVVDPNSDRVQLYVDGALNGQTEGTLGSITLDLFDLCIGCLHNEAGYSGYYTGCVDEPVFYTKVLSATEVRGIYQRQPASGISRVGSGTWAMIYLAAESEALVEKLMRGRVLDKATGGDADKPWVELTGEDQAEILGERSWSRDFSTSTQISAVVGYVIDDSVDELYKDIDATNRTIVNSFRNEACDGVLRKLAESATFATGELGATYFVDPGGCFRFKKYGAFSCHEAISDGSDGNLPNILDIQVKETIKAEPRMANDVKVIIFEEGTEPADSDALTESTDGWTSPDPTDAGYPISDAADKAAGTASIHFNTTNPGATYRMRLAFGDIDVSGYDQVSFYLKYGSGLSLDSLQVTLLKGTLGVTGDYLKKSGITPPGAAAWHEVTVPLSGMAVYGNPGNVVNAFELRADHATQIGTGGFLIDKLRFIRTEKSGSASDTTSQASFGRRTLTVVDKNISSTTWAANVASNIVANRKHPIIIAHARAPGMAQPGYRPPQTVNVTSLKDGLSSAVMQIVRADHQITVGEGYVVDLDLIAAKTSTVLPAYSALVGPALHDVQTILGEWRRRLKLESTNVLRSRYS